MVAVVASSVATSTNNTDAISVTVTKPTGTLEGHLMIAVTHGYVADTFTPPSGWTFLGLVDDSVNLRSRAYMKIAGASEPANYTFTFQPGPGGGTIGASITTFSGHGGLDSVVLNVVSDIDPVDFAGAIPSTDGINYSVYTWRDTTSDTVTWTNGTELFDVNAGDAGLTQYRGQSGAWQVGEAGVFNAMTANPTNSITHGILWDFAIADAVPANESWASTGNAVELEINNTWVDVTSDVRYEQAVSVTRGTSSQGGQVNPSVASFTLDNISGKYSVLNPTSTYYPYLNLTVPCRISKAYGTVAMETLGFYNVTGNRAQPVDRFRTPHKDSLAISGDIDIRVDVEPETWKMNQVLAAKAQIPQDGLVSSWVFFLTDEGVPALHWRTSDTYDTSEYVSATASVGSALRQALRVTLDVNNGSGGHTVTFYTSDSLGGSWTQLGDAVVISGLTDINAVKSFSVVPTCALTVGALEPYFAQDGTQFFNTNRLPAPVDPLNMPPLLPFRGRIYGMELKSGIGGTTVAKPTFDTQTTGTKSFTDAQSNLWTAYGNALCHNRKYRHHGEVTSWPQPRDITGNEAWVDIESTGVLNREQQGTPSEDSALYKFYTAPAGIADTSDYTIFGGPFFPVAYWPMEDNALPGAVDGESPQEETGSGLHVQKPGVITGTVEFGSDNTFFASRSAAKINTGSMIRFPVIGAVSGGWLVDFILYAPDGITNGTRIVEIRQTGTAELIRLTYTSTNTMELTVHDNSGTQIDTTGTFALATVRKHNRIRINSVDGIHTVYLESQSDRLSSFVAETVSTTTTGAVYDVRINANQLMGGAYMAHVAVFDGTNAGQDYFYGMNFDILPTMAAPMDAWRREPAARRAERLTWEQQLINYNIGSGGPWMGIQGAKSFVESMQEVQATDMGYLYEPRNVLGLGYRTRTSMYNQPVMLDLSYEGNDLSGTFSPIRDNRGSVNDMTVVKDFGTRGRYELTEGTRSTQRPPNGIGRYRDEQTISLYQDSDLPGQAQWRVFVGTREDLRVDTITIALENPRIGGVADNIYRFYTADIGDRISLTDLPDLLLPDDMDLVISGYSETFDQFQHSITFNCVPGSSFNIGKAVITTGTTVSKADSLTTTLNEDLDTTETGVDVAITSGSALWTTSGVDFDIIVGGERMTVTSVSGASSPQTFTVTRSVNGVVKTHSTGAQVKLFRPAIAGL